MNKSTGIMFVTTLIVVVGRWSKKQNVDWNIVPYLLVATIIIGMISMANEKLADGFALIALVTAILAYGPDIFINNPNMNPNASKGPGPWKSGYVYH